MTHEQIREVIEETLERVNAQTFSTQADAILSALTTAGYAVVRGCDSCGGLNTSCPEGCERDPLTGELLPAPADLCGGEVVAWMYANKSTDDVSITLHRMSDLPFNRERWTEHPLYAKPQQPAAEGSRCPHCGSPRTLIPDVDAHLAALSSRSATSEVGGEELVERTIARLKALPDYAGRPAWDAIVAEELAAASDAIRAETTAQVVAWLHAEMTGGGE